MKKVLVEFVDAISIELIDNQSIVGISFGGTKTYVLENSGGGFIGLKLSDQTTFSKWSTSTKKEYVKEALKQMNTEAFVFESQEELLTWLLEK